MRTQFDNATFLAHDKLLSELPNDGRARLRFVSRRTGGGEKTNKPRAETYSTVPQFLRCCGPSVPYCDRREREAGRILVTLSRSKETVSLICIVGVAPSSPNRRKVRVIASCFVVVVLAVGLVGTPRPPCRGDVSRIGRERTGSGTLPISGSRKSISEEVTVGERERTRQQSIPATPLRFFNGGGICKGLYAFSCRQVVSFAGSESLMRFCDVHEIHQ